MEQGVAPDELLTTQTFDGAGVATRPVFNYPLISQWNGTGDPTRASSFAAAEPATPADETYDWIGKELFTSAGEARRLRQQP